jgi:hypothetical protein
VNDTELDLSLGKGGGNRIWKSGQTIDTGNQHIFDAPVLKFCQDGKPEFGTFIFGQP